MCGVGLGKASDLAMEMARNRVFEVRLIRIAASPFRRALDRWDSKRMEAALVRRLIGNADHLRRYKEELISSGLLGHLEEARKDFVAKVQGRTARGDIYGVGNVGRDEGLRLYAIVRHVRPDQAVETGVCNGFSTAFILQAMANNRKGHLSSIDLPEVANHPESAIGLWEGKKGAVIPPDEPPGWVIPEHLKGRWTLVLGRSQEKLPGLLNQVGVIDLFMHDSEHSYECMTFEYTEAFRVLRPGGVLISDDVAATTAWSDFVNAQGLASIAVSRRMSCVVK